MERSQGAEKRSARVALDVHDIGFSVPINGFERSQNPCRGRSQRLARCHRVEIVIRLNAKSREDLIEHLAMLSGNCDSNRKFLRPRFHVEYDGAQLDCFRAGAKDKEGFHHVFESGAGGTKKSQFYR
jgi:hypothetical protein